MSADQWLCVLLAVVAVVAIGASAPTVVAMWIATRRDG